MSSIIELDDVSFSYAADAPRALDHVALAIPAGSFTGVIGPSGAGKSTLAAVLSGAIPHHFRGEFFGAALVEGRDTCEITLTDIARVVGHVNQDIDAQMVASVVEDELLFGLENFGIAHERIEERISAALGAVGIADLRDREIATLSGGQKQKVAIAAILALAPRVLVMDEPTAALDPVSSRMVFEVLRDLNEREGITVVVIEQKVALLAEFCDRLVVMDHGRIALAGTPHEVFAHADKLRAIGVDSPRTARVSNSLAARGLCPAEPPALSVDEAVELIEGILRGREAGGSAAGPEAPLAGGRASAGAPASAPAASVAAADGDPANREFSASGEPVLAFRGVTFAYPGGGASVNNLDLAVYPGELVGIIGQNGAGKTTATKLINGLLRPSSGSVAVAGLDTRTVPVSQIARHVATLFQNPDHQLCKNTVLDEVAFSLELAGTDKEEARRRARRVIERFGLPADEAPFSLSRGQRQMVALASVVVTEPEIVVLDEPTSGLDYRECMTVMETVREMAAQGSAVIMVCHDMEVVSDFAERLVVMADGCILGAGPTRAIFGDAALMERSRVAPPQVTALSERLARTVSPAFAGLSEVAEIVQTTERLAGAAPIARADPSAKDPDTPSGKAARHA